MEKLNKSSNRSTTFTTTSELKEFFDREFENFQNKVEAEHGKISEKAIDKALRIMLVWAGILTAIIGISSLMGWQDIKESVAAQVEKKVNNWFSFGTVKSPIETQLQMMRDRYLIDSVTIRYLRARADDRTYTYKVSDDEIADLIRIANNKETSLADYDSILNAIKAARSRLSFMDFPSDYRGEVFGKVFTEPGFRDQINKQKALLSTFSYDLSLVKFARTAINEDWPHLSDEAFDLLANTRSSEAIPYAETHILNAGYEYQNRAFAIYLAREKPDSERLTAYIDSLLSKKIISEGWFQEYFSIMMELFVGSTISPISIIAEQKKDTQNEIALEMMSKAIGLGARTRINNHFEDRLIFFVPDEYGYTLEYSDVEKIYKNDEILDSLVLRSPEDMNWIKSVVRTFQVNQAQKNIVTIKLELLANTVIRGEDAVELRPGDTASSVWLSLDEDSGNLIAKHRNLSGNFQSFVISDIVNAQKSKFKFLFNEQELYRFAPFKTEF